VIATKASATNVPKVPGATGKNPTGPSVAICFRIERIAVFKHTTNEILEKDLVPYLSFDI
jgi:hypothetical protein